MFLDWYWLFTAESGLRKSEREQCSRDTRGRGATLQLTAINLLSYRASRERQSGTRPKNTAHASPDISRYMRLFCEKTIWLLYEVFGISWSTSAEGLWRAGADTRIANASKTERAPGDLADRFSHKTTIKTDRDFVINSEPLF